jgi:hypothetical protein
MTDAPRPKPGSPRALFRKNTPAETRENWQLVKSKGKAWGRLFFLLIALLLLCPFGLAFYGKGYFDGVQAVRTETISKESNHVR